VPGQKQLSSDNDEKLFLRSQKYFVLLLLIFFHALGSSSNGALSIESALATMEVLANENHDS